MSLPLPAVLRLRCGDALPKPASTVTVSVHRQPLRVASDAQTVVADLWRRHRRFGSAVKAEINAAGILDHCGFLSTELPGGPLVFRRIAWPTVRALGREWALSQLGRPNDEDPFSEYATLIGAEYREALEAGEPVYNRLVIHGLPQEVNYSHLLVGWRSPAGQQALLTCIDWPGV
jgi:hypothetical protein